MIEIIEVDRDALEEFASIPMWYSVNSIFDVLQNPNGSFTLNERTIDSPYTKDYGDLRDQSPISWPQDFDISNWGFFFARINGKTVGAAAVAFDTPEVDMLEGRRDLADLWDIRVHPEARGKGVGAALMEAVEEWARTRKCGELKIETQNINVPACRFYERHGYSLRVVRRKAYPDLPEEIQLLWYKDLLSKA